MKENASNGARILYLVCACLVFIAIPILCLFFVCFQICRGQLLQLNDLYEGRLRFLALFFAKILFVEILVSEHEVQLKKLFYDN